MFYDFRTELNKMKENFIRYIIVKHENTKSRAQD